MSARSAGTDGSYRADVDVIGRPLRDLRISVTDRCNFRCVYCMPRDTFGPDHAFLPRAEILTFEEITRLAGIFTRLGVSKVRLTGGEPLVRGEHNRRGFGKRTRRCEDLGAGIDVPPHDRKLARRQLRRFRDEGFGHRGLADVVHARGDWENRSELDIHAHFARDGDRIPRDAFGMRHRVRRPIDRDADESVLFADPRGRPLQDGRAHLLGPVHELQRQHRVPAQLLERLLPPLTPAIDGELEAIPMKRLDEKVRDRRRRPPVVQKIRIRGGDDDRGVRVIALQLGREPEAVVPRHHHVDHGEVVVLGAQRRERFIGIRRGLRPESKRFHPARHDVAHRRFIINNEHRRQ